MALGGNLSQISYSCSRIVLALANTIVEFITPSCKAIGLSVLKALAFDSMYLVISLNVISLCLLLVMTSATLHHLCLN